MLHTLEKGEYPKGHRYWSNATGDLNAAMYDGSYAADLGIGYPELVELARGRAEELGAERLDIHVVFAEDVDQWKADDPFTEIWVVMPWDVDADAFHEVADWFNSRCYFNE